MRSSFRTDTRGSVATMAGLAFGMAAVAVGAGVDYTNATNKRHELQKATDAAVLAAAALPGVTNEERLTRASEMYLGSRFCQEQTCAEPTVAMDGSAITLGGEVMIPTTLLFIAGVPEVEVDAVSSAVPVTETPVEVVMILDYSGSMNRDNKYQDMASAATQFLDSAETQPSGFVSVGVVPFSKYVLTPMQGRYLFDVSTGNNLMGQNVVGCVLNREHPYSTNADEPSTALEGSLWPVFSYAAGTTSAFSDTYTGPSNAYSTTSTTQVLTVNGTPQTLSYEISYYDNDPGSAPSAPTTTVVIDAVGAPVMQVDGHGKFNLSVRLISGHGAQIVNQGLVPQPDPFGNFGGYGGSSGWSDGDDSGLPTVYDQSLLAENLSGDCGQYATNSLWARPLSSELGDLKTSISQMRPIGLTNIALGMDIGWHMLTPDAPFTEASTDDSPEPDKVAILLTDGVQTVRAHGSTGSVSIGSANENIIESCEAMKADGIEIFTIAFDVQDQYTRDLLKNCATREPNYFEPNAGGALDEVFEAIFEKVVQGEVRLTG